MHSFPARMLFTRPTVFLSSDGGVRVSYEQPQLKGAARQNQLDGRKRPFAYQSRSSPPSQPWLGPDIGDYIHETEAKRALVVVPLGFLSDHMEVIYDLDTWKPRRWRRSAASSSSAQALAGTHPDSS